MQSFRNWFFKISNFFILLLFVNKSFAIAQMNMSPGVTPISQDIYRLHMTIFLICVVIGVIVFSALGYALIKHRKAAGHKAAEFHEHTSLEIFWSVVPLLILIMMAIPATKVLINMNNSDKPDVNIKITGYQWRWKYEYLDNGISFFSNLATPYNQIQNKAPKNKWYLLEVDKPLVVPIHKKIRFLITSNDVNHSWWVPALGIKRDAIPGFIYEAWARIDKPGIYRGQCAELCGMNHGYMPIVVQAETWQDYQKWLIQNAPAGTVPGQVAPAQPTAPAAPPSAVPAPAAQPITPSAPAAPAPTTAPTTPTAAPAAPPPAAQPSAAPGVAAPATTAQPAATGPMSKEDLMKRGAQVYTQICVVCHQPEGQGMPPTFPALKGSKIAIGPVAAHIDIVLHGKKNTQMQAFGEQLNDADIAAVITYERNSWDNDKAGKDAGGIVQPADVTAAKKQQPPQQPQQLPPQ